MAGWIAVDLDGTLAYYEGWVGPSVIGDPIQPMVDRVHQWLEEGKDVRIFTARAGIPEQIPPVEEWCIKYLGRKLPVTNIKDYTMGELWDDRCVQIEPNTGRRMDGKK